MGDWRMCYDYIKEMFPEVDKRMIKAVALEHKNDIGSAVDFILNEVVPSSNFTSAVSQHDVETNNERTQKVTSEPISPSTSFSTISVPFFVLPSADKEVSSVGENHSTVTDGRLHFEGNGADQSEDMLYDETDNNFCAQKSNEFNYVIQELNDGAQKSNEFNYVIQELNDSHTNVMSSHHSASNQSDDGSRFDMSALEHGLAELEQESRPGFLSDKSVVSGTSSPLENSIASGYSYLGSGFKLGCSINSMGDSSIDCSIASGIDGSLSCSSLSTFKQEEKMESLTDLYNNAKKDKEKLLNALESINSLREEAETEELSARHAREEASMGGLSVMAKVDELRQTLLRAKETNAMHASEVYGERSILATEARELQARLSQLAAEEVRAFSLIEETRKKLEERIDTAKRDREAAEEEKLKREEDAINMLATEELQMTKVAQQSRDLEMEAEANAKLKEFLMDRGQVVDALQGEVVVLCEDIKTLKEQIDAGISKVAAGLTCMKRSFRRTSENERAEDLCGSLDGSVSANNENQFGYVNPQSLNSPSDRNKEIKESVIETLDESLGRQDSLNSFDLNISLEPSPTEEDRNTLEENLKGSSSQGSGSPRLDDDWQVVLDA